MKKTIKKSKIIIMIAIILVIILIVSLITSNVINNRLINSKNYEATITNVGSELIAGYIKKGIKVGDITGTLEVLDTSDATATPEDIAWGKTAYVDGEKIVGTANYTFKDSLGNIVVVPGGFDIVNKDQNVPDGIIIEDQEGNQFVWIPTGEYINSNGELVTNELSRRLFLTAGPNLINGDDLIGEYYYGEGDSRSCIYGTDYDISYFKRSSAINGGFYIGRYEASGEEGNVRSVEGATPYTNISRDKALSESQNMYKDDTHVVSTLISSYAWDTALNFIIQNSEVGPKLAVSGDSTYSNSRTGIPTKTGEYTADKYSNICDFLGNMYELSTEFSSDDTYDCVFRGGGYKERGNYFPALRDYSNNSLAFESRGFRVELYIR